MHIWSCLFFYHFEFVPGSRMNMMRDCQLQSLSLGSIVSLCKVLAFSLANVYGDPGNVQDSTRLYQLWAIVDSP